VNDPDGGRQIQYSLKYGDVQKNLLAYVILIGSPKDGATVSQETLTTLRYNASQTVWKAQQLKEGFGADVYPKEIIDTIIG
jgi:hypothetical protein